MKPLAIGDSNFKTIVQNGYYIDKTGFIKEIIDNFFGTKLFLRPRRFGKTTNMFMLKEYFDITKKEENINLFNDLYIDIMYGNIKTLIMELYENNKHIRERLEAYQCERYNSILMGKAEYVEYQNALKTLIGYLNEYYNQKIIVLIDEYDAPLNKAYLKGFGEQAIGFLQTFLSGALKDNSNVQVGVLTGVLQIGQKSIFSDLNNFEPYSVIRNQASEYFGFTKEEVKQMLKDFEMEDKYEEIEKWYNGYNINNVPTFNPWSILNCIKQQGICNTYWVKTGNSDLVNLATEGISAEIVETVEKLLKCMQVEVMLKDKAVYEEIKGNAESFVNTLLFTGYLTIDKKYQKEDNNWYASVRIPNVEVRTILQEMQKTWLPTSFENELLDNICIAVMNQNEEELEKQMKKLILEETSFFSSSEDYYKGMFMCAMLRLPKEYIRSTENETGRGRSDYEIYKEDKSIGMIYEFKVCNSQRTLEKAAKEGMKQIHDREYYTRMQKLGIKEIWLYSVAFCQKKMLIKKEKLRM